MTSDHPLSSIYRQIYGSTLYKLLSRKSSSVPPGRYTPVPSSGSSGGKSSSTSGKGKSSSGGFTTQKAIGVVKTIGKGILAMTPFRLFGAATEYVYYTGQKRAVETALGKEIETYTSIIEEGKREGKVRELDQPMRVPTEESYRRYEEAVKRYESLVSEGIKTGKVKEEGGKLVVYDESFYRKITQAERGIHEAKSSLQYRQIEAGTLLVSDKQTFEKLQIQYSRIQQFEKLRGEAEEKLQQNLIYKALNYQLPIPAFEDIKIVKEMQLIESAKREFLKSKAPQPLKPAVSTLEWGEKFSFYLVEGSYEGIRTKPVETAIVGGITAAASAGVGGLAVMAARAGMSGIAVARGVGIGVTALYGYGKTLELGSKLDVEPYRLGFVPVPNIPKIAEQSLKRPEVLGRFTGETISTELIPAWVGMRFTYAYSSRLFARAEVYEAIHRGNLPKNIKKELLSSLEIAKHADQPVVKEFSAITKRISPREAKIVEKFISLEKGKLIIGGSAGARTQYWIEGYRMPKDIDIYVKGWRDPSKIAKQFISYARQHGIKEWYIKEARSTNVFQYIFQPQKASMAKAEIFSPKGKVMEFHTALWFKSAPWYLGTVKTPKGIEVVSFPEQMYRKISGIALTYGLRGRKDIEDLRKMIKQTFSKQAERAQKEFLFKEYRKERLKEMEDIFLSALKRPKIKIKKAKLEYLYPKQKSLSIYTYYKPYKPYSYYSYKPYSYKSYSYKLPSYSYISYKPSTYLYKPIYKPPSYLYKPIVPYYPLSYYKPIEYYPKISSSYKPPVPPLYIPIKQLQASSPSFPNLFGVRKGFQYPQLKKQPKIYQPQLTALIFKIKGKKIKTLTGLEFRPLA